jgi:hypothetical protein
MMETKREIENETSSGSSTDGVSVDETERVGTRGATYHSRNTTEDTVKKFQQ